MMYYNISMEPKITRTTFEGLFIIESKIFNDQRGFFTESWNKKNFSNVGLGADFIQENHSLSKKGVLRGIHYQNMQEPIIKLVRCISGEIYDVVIDLRLSSNTFGRWFGIYLNENNNKQLYIPIGFAHGFIAISDFAEVEYKQDGYYNTSSEGTIAWDDKDIAIDWPIKNPILSEKDKKGMSLKEYIKTPAFK